MKNTLPDLDNPKEMLFGVELTCIFVLVGLLCYAVGWVKSRQAHLSTLNAEWMGEFVEPIPVWVEYGIYLFVAVLLIAAAVDLYIELQEKNVLEELQIGD